MRTNINASAPREVHEATASDSDLLCFKDPREIVRDPLLTVARKRQLLAYWASDIHAVTGAPALRRYAHGPAVLIDDIKAALLELDGLRPEAPAPRSGPWSLRRGHWSRLGRRWRQGRDDDDDDDPFSPAPAAPRPVVPSLQGDLAAA